MSTWPPLTHQDVQDEVQAHRTSLTSRPASLVQATGKYWAGWHAASSTVLVTATGRYYVAPVWSPVAITIDQVLVFCTTAAAGIFTTLGYYPNQSGDTPVGATLQTLGTIDTTSTGVIALTLGSNLSLPAGWSHFAAAVSGGAPRFRQNNYTEDMPVVYNVNTLADGGITSGAAGLWNGASGTLPTTLPSGLTLGSGLRFTVRIASIP